MLDVFALLCLALYIYLYFPGVFTNVSFHSQLLRGLVATLSGPFSAFFLSFFFKYLSKFKKKEEKFAFSHAQGKFEYDIFEDKLILDHHNISSKRGFVIFGFEGFDLLDVVHEVANLVEGGKGFCRNDVSEIFFDLHGDFYIVQGIESMITENTVSGQACILGYFYLACRLSCNSFGWS